MKTNTNEKGFTIIEVVLVLAIAALIFLMIFIALPALQRNQRDTSRKNNVNIVASAVNTYRSAKRVNLTAADTTALQDYVGNLDLAAKTDVKVVASDALSGSVIAKTILDANEYRVLVGTKCAGGDATATGTARQVAVVTGLENDGTTATLVCQEV